MSTTRRKKKTVQNSSTVDIGRPDLPKISGQQPTHSKRQNNRSIIRHTFQPNSNLVKRLG